MLSRFAASNQPMYVKSSLQTHSASKVKTANDAAPAYLSAPAPQYAPLPTFKEDPALFMDGNAPCGFQKNSIWQPDVAVEPLPDSSFWSNLHAQWPMPNGPFSASEDAFVPELRTFVPGECGTAFVPMCGQADHDMFMQASHFNWNLTEASTDASHGKGAVSESSFESFDSPRGLELPEAALAFDALPLSYPPGLEPQFLSANNLGSIKSDEPQFLSANNLGTNKSGEPKFLPASNLGMNKCGAAQFPTASKVDTSKGEVQGEITTLMVCDIPCRESIEQLMGVMDAVGFSKTYDLVYMPGQRGRQTSQGNVGYAFVNFKKAEWATAFMSVFQNIHFPNSASTKLSYAKPAREQGFAANYMMHSRKNAVGSLLTFCDESQ